MEFGSTSAVLPDNNNLAHERSVRRTPLRTKSKWDAEQYMHIALLERKEFVSKIQYWSKSLPWRKPGSWQHFSPLMMYSYKHAFLPNELYWLLKYNLTWFFFFFFAIINIWTHIYLRGFKMTKISKANRTDGLHFCSYNIMYLRW